MLNITVDSKQVEAALDSMPATVRAALQTKVEALVINLQHHVVADKLQGQVLHHRSGALARSIQKDVTATDDMVTGEVFSSGDVKYAAIHEFGGTTPPHDIVPDKAKALSFVIGGKQVFATIVHHPGSKIPERSFLRSSLADQASEIMEGLRQAALEGMRKGLSE